MSGRRGNRVERSKPKDAQCPLLAVPPQIAQAAQRPAEVTRSLRHPVIRVGRLHLRVELTEVAAGTCVLSWGARSGTRHGAGFTGCVRRRARSSPRVRWRHSRSVLTADRASLTVPLPIGIAA